MTYSSAIEFLYGLRWFGTKLGLDQTRRLAGLAGNPQDALRFIHVAGTNGKGSVCAMLDSIYRRAGFKVGLFTSPHLVAFGERIQINRLPLPDRELIRLVQRLRGFLKSLPAQAHPTFFEVVTVMALLRFAEQQCDLVIWETGMGGRLDATNVVTPIASVVTNVGLDHLEWLGTDVDAIAREKAGILKPGVPAVTAAQGRAAEVIAGVAQACRAPLRQVTESEAMSPAFEPERLALRGRHQRWNAALAAAVVEVLSGRLAVTSEAVAEGLAAVRWPGRFQEASLSDGRCVVLDGAHNGEGMSALAATWRERFPGRKPAVILGMLADKNWPAMCRTAAAFAGRILAAPVASARSASTRDLAEACRRAAPGLKVTEHATCGDALRAAAVEPLVLVTGSLYLVGEAMTDLGLSSAPEADERRLNEWGFDKVPGKV